MIKILTPFFPVYGLYIFYLGLVGRYSFFPVQSWWYIPAVLYLYALFYIGRMFITRSVAFIAYIFVGLVIYWLFTGIVLRLPFFWWKAIFSFLAGVMYVDFEKRISILYLCVAQILLLLLTLTCGFTIRFMAEHLMVAMNGILIIHALRCFPIHSKILTLLGIISYEIYLLHGVFLNEFAMFTGGVYALCVIGATLAVAIVYHAGRMKGLRI